MLFLASHHITHVFSQRIRSFLLFIHILRSVLKDKVKINSLTMVAEDHAETTASAKAIYDIIRKRIMSTGRDNLLPLVYVLDSILKNVKGKFIDVVEVDVAKWMPVVYRQLQKPQRAKLQKVWKTWNEFKIFSTDSWKAMGECFDEGASTKATNVAGITRTVSRLLSCSHRGVHLLDVLRTNSLFPRQNTGSLLLSTSLRRSMQGVLDEIQSGMENELEKVSLERLAEINPDLLENIKQAALSNMGNDGSNNKQDESQTHHLPVFFTETRSQEILDQSKAWGEVKWDHLEETHALVTQLQHRVRHGASAEERYTQQEAIGMTQYLAAASATAGLLTEALERIKNQQDRKDHKSLISFPGAENAVGSGSAVSSRGFTIDKSEFTNNGIKKKNASVIGLLYEVGLPFISSADGRRFATQLELSNHLDKLFKKNQLEKTMARTEERGWYSSDAVWTGETKEVDMQNAETAASTPAVEEEGGLEDSTVPADETRDRCVICGINFKMFFDNDDGIYMYSNCREIDVLNDDAAERESEQCLVHITCWRGLGSPVVLTTDQALQDTLPH
jgi:pre-mRNA cleavage complex 2 protein Pcf11